jgi:putative transcriptional regulator
MDTECFGRCNELMLVRYHAGMSAGLLVASPQMIDLFFAKTVVLLCEYTEEGAIGIVVNRLTGLDSDNVLSQMKVEDRGGIVGPVHWGGPVQPGAVFLIFARPSPADGKQDDAVFRLGDEVGVSPSRDVIEAVAADSENPGAFLSLGYAGWAPGQLDGEIQTGSWIHMEIEPKVLFSLPAEERWQHCIDSLGVDPMMIWMNPVNE